VSAAATREEILRAARRLFTTHGYANTSIQQIAAESGVAIQTIYTSVGSKSALVLALNDLIDSEAGVPELAAAVAQETKPAQVLAKGVHLTRVLNERCGDIIRVVLNAEAADPDLAAAHADGMRRHRQGAEGLGQRLAGLGVLRPGTSAAQATAAFALMTAPSSWLQLTEDAGWSYDEAESWLVMSLTRLLLARAR
jgi:AcrR family transcriptional regulator